MVLRDREDTEEPAVTSSDRAPIVVAVADDHDAALRYAAGEAVRDRRPLRVVHVVPPVRGVSSMRTMLISFEAVELIAQDLLQQQYQRAQDLVGDAVPVERVLRRGAVAEMLIEQTRDADHLVLQRREASRLGRILTGSTAGALAARSPVPVVSVPETWSGPAQVPHVTVALGDHDVKGHEDPLLTWAFTEAEARDAALDVLHAWYLPIYYGELDMTHPKLEDWQRLAQQEIDARLLRWRRAHPGVDVRVDVTHMRPIDAIVEASAHTDLMVVGRRRSHGIVHLGSVVRSAVREAECPLVVVTPESRSAAPHLTAHQEATSP
jgi:nucleotide-binding universal stress UspA family protein